MIDKVKMRIRKMRRYILGTICLSSVVFIFQACYGVDDGYGEYISGKVLSRSGMPIAHIKVSLDEYERRDSNSDQIFTDTTGRFYFYSLDERAKYRLRFEDLDSVQNNTNRRNVFFKSKDTIVKGYSDFTIVLDEK